MNGLSQHKTSWSQFPREFIQECSLKNLSSHLSWDELNMWLKSYPSSCSLPLLFFPQLFVLLGGQKHILKVPKPILRCFFSFLRHRAVPQYNIRMLWINTWITSSAPISLYLNAFVTVLVGLIYSLLRDTSLGKNTCGTSSCMRAERKKEIPDWRLEMGGISTFTFLARIRSMHTECLNCRAFSQCSIYASIDESMSNHQTGI